MIVVIMIAEEYYNIVLCEMIVKMTVCNYINNHALSSSLLNNLSSTKSMYQHYHYISQTVITITNTTMIIIIIKTFQT